jgi:uncharacterized membrane protein
MAVAALALGGVCLSIYLTLYKVGVIGRLACNVGHCETVNTSRWSVMFGIPIAAWGFAFYLTLFVVSLVGIGDRFADMEWMSKLLVLMTGWGVLFSAWLTYLELFVIHAMCVWCVTSAVLITVTFLVSVMDWRETARLEGASPQGDAA